MKSEFERLMDDLMRTRADHLEKFAAAFLKEVGSSEASKYELVECRSDDGSQIRWYWRRKDEK